MSVFFGPRKQETSFVSAYSDFQHSIASARSLTAMYAELRAFRGLGRRGPLAPPNEDLLWLPRSAVVAAISALDEYVHAVVYDRLPAALRSNPVPDELCEAMAGIIPIRNAGSFRDALVILSAADTHAALTARLRDRVLSSVSYQAPQNIEGAYQMIGHERVFDAVAGQWPGPRTSAEDIKRRLANYVRRRNQIAHEGDREISGAVRQMQPQYSNACAEFVEDLVSRLNRVVYNAP